MCFTVKFNRKIRSDTIRETEQREASVDTLLTVEPCERKTVTGFNTILLIQMSSDVSVFEETVEENF